MSCDPEDMPDPIHEPTTEEIIDAMIASRYPSNTTTCSSIDFNAPPYVTPPKRRVDPVVSASAFMNEVNNHLAHTKKVQKKRDRRKQLAKQSRKRNRHV